MYKKNARAAQLKKGQTPPKKPKKFSRLQGVRDTMHKEYKYWDLVRKKASDLAKYYSFDRIEIPVLERATLFDVSTGKDSGIVSKELYSFVDKTGDKVAMRPEATPGIVRAFIDRGIMEPIKPKRFFWTGPLFRHENSQSKKLRQHNQFNYDVFGEESPVVDAQLVLIGYNFFSELQVNTQVQINSIGCSECRKEYIKKLVTFYKERGKRSKLCNSCKKNFTKNPFLLLDCEEASCVEVREDAPQVIDFLCDNCREHFIMVLEYLDDLNIPYNLSPFLVRGLDYYTGTVFEFIPLEAENSENEEEVKNKKKPMVLGGGGRYNELIEKMGGVSIPACGFGIGVERVIQKIKENNIPINKDEGDIIFVSQIGEEPKKKAILIFEEMRRAGYNVRQHFTESSLQTQLEESKELKARYTLILGQKELLDGTIIIRDMESGAQEVIDRKKLYPEIDKRLSTEEE